MKLLSKTTIYYFLFSLPVFAICSVLLYNHVASEIQHSVDEELWKEKIKAEAKFKSGDYTKIENEDLTLFPMGNIPGSDEPQFSDTFLYDSIEGEMLPYRVMTSTITDGKSRAYLVARKSTMESDDLVESLIYPVLVLFILLLAGFFLINVWISRKLWSPFYRSLEKLNDFNLSSEAISFDRSSVKEFNELNIALKRMTEKTRADYISQKEFTENASHEMQTPLAVMCSRIELLIQSSSITEKDMQIIQSVYNAACRLSVLNKALLLLSKIENDHFREEENVDLGVLLEKTLLHYEDMAALKGILVSRKGTAAFHLKMSPALADILLGNLIQNAIRHNVQNGSIYITLSDNMLSISNSSDQQIENTQELFKRFRKNEGSAESVGLGLAIVKEICERYKIGLSYTCVEKVHTISLRMKE
jgi:signal transduction histidine kinase